MVDVSRRWGRGLFLALLLCGSAASAASPEQTGAARAAAQAGVESFNQGDYAQALDRFERAERMLHASSHVLYQARCHEKLGNLIRARELYNKLAREVLPADAPQAFRDAQKTAQEELPALEARVPYVTISVKGAEASDLAVTADGNKIPNDILGLPYPINPGTHEMTAKTPDGRSASGKVTLEEGQRATLTLTIEATAPVAASTKPDDAPSTAPPSVTQPDQPTSNAKPWMKPVGYAALGTGVVGAALGTVMYLRGSSKHSDAENQAKDCKPSCSDSQVSTISDLDSQAETAGVVAVVGFALGAVGIASGTTLLLLAPKPTAQVAIAPFLTPNSAGLVGSF